MIRILIAGDRQLLREGLRRLLSDHEDLSVIAEAGSYTETVKAVYSRDIDVAVLDLSTPGRDGVEITGHIKAIRPAMRTLVLSIYAEQAIVLRGLRVQALSDGIDGYMAKETAPEEMIALIRRLGGGSGRTCPVIAERSAQATAPDSAVGQARYRTAGTPI